LKLRKEYGDRRTSYICGFRHVSSNPFDTVLPLIDWSNLFVEILGPFAESGIVIPHTKLL